MSTRASILYSPDAGVHLFEDVGMGYEHDGLHLDITTGVMDSDSQYGGFDFDDAAERGRSDGSAHLRLPVEVCEAIADFVLKRRRR